MPVEQCKQTERNVEERNHETS